jgi:DNA adenine methylase
MYRHEMTEQNHVELAQVLRGLRGHVVLSGYDSPLYANLYGDWQKHTRPARADQGLPRTEVVWIKSAVYVQATMLDTV